ncbi:MAG: hypothetical protein H6Q71_180 [Firmicutes bacterium]|nr:hypothetical protein [Bacillota bacterium]
MVKMTYNVGQPSAGFSDTIHVWITARDTKSNETSVIFKLILGAAVSDQETLQAETMKINLPGNR